MLTRRLPRRRRTLFARRHRRGRGGTRCVCRQHYLPSPPHPQNGYLGVVAEGGRDLACAAPGTTMSANRLSNRRAYFSDRRIGPGRYAASKKRVGAGRGQKIIWFVHRMSSSRFSSHVSAAISGVVGIPGIAGSKGVKRWTRRPTARRGELPKLVTNRDLLIDGRKLLDNTCPALNGQETFRAGDNS